jgi:hypothetical protein
MPSPYTLGSTEIGDLKLAKFATVYMPERDDDPLSVRTVLRDAFGVFALAFFLSGVACLVGIACFASGGEMTEAADILRKAKELWQPIVTAPKDGSRIILADHKNLVTGYWSPPNNGWRCDWMVGEPGDKPTHWMPLPPLPDRAIALAESSP